MPSRVAADRAVAHRRWGPDAASATAAVLAVAVAWVALKLVSVWAWVVLPAEYGDTYYYFLTAQEAFRTGGGIRSAFSEYPTPAGLLLLWPYAAGADDYDSYRTLVVWTTSVVDAAFALLLGRRTGPAGVLGWMALTTVLGQVALLRFDMLPAVTAGAAVLLASQGAGRAASVLVALGTGLKVWPVVLAPLALGVDAGRRRLGAVGAFVATGAGLVAVSLAAGGWERLVSPLGYQRDRGLQIEAVPATPVMHAWATEPGYRVWYSTFHAFEVEGPVVERWLAVADAAGLVAAVASVALVALWVWRHCPQDAVGPLALTLVGAFVITSRALSPQYLLWLAAPAAAILGIALGRRRPAPVAAGLAAGTATYVAVLVLCALTTAIYPTYYGGLTGVGEHTPRALALLTARNAGLVALVAWTATLAVHASAVGSGARVRGAR